MCFAAYDVDFAVVMTFILLQKPAVNFIVCSNFEYGNSEKNMLEKNWT